MRTLILVAALTLIAFDLTASARAQCYSGDTICQGQQNNRMFEENQRRQQDQFNQQQRDFQQRDWQLQQQNQQRYP